MDYLYVKRGNFPGSVACRRLQTAAATAVTGCRSAAPQKGRVGRRSSPERRDRLNDKHTQRALNEACWGLELAVFALL